MKRKSIFAAMLALGLLLTLLPGCSKKVQNYTVAIKVKDYGTITVALDAKAAPITVKNFIDLVNAKFYDGLTFHRVIQGFMIQGGDPNHDGSGGSAKTIKGEFKANGVNNPLSHTRGTISMARADDYNSASSQFFITDSDTYVSSLDGNYAAFGKVTDGMDVVDAIASSTKVEPNSDGSVLYENQPVIESIRVVDSKTGESK